MTKQEQQELRNKIAVNIAGSIIISKDNINDFDIEELTFIVNYISNSITCKLLDEPFDYESAKNDIKLLK